MVDEIVVIKLFLFVFITLSWSDNVNYHIIFLIIISETKVFSNLFKLSDVAGPIESIVRQFC